METVMNNTESPNPKISQVPGARQGSQRAHALADTLEKGARELATFAATLTDERKEVALDLLRRNSEAAAAAIRALTNEQLNGSATVSLYAGAPLTCQFMLEDHFVRHSYHHLARIREAVQGS